MRINLAPYFYGIFGKGKSSTSINAGIWIPDANNNWSEIVSFGTKANFEVTTAGIGFTPTIGIGGGWLTLDMNVAWTYVSALEKPAVTFIFRPRLGKSFKLRKPYRLIAMDYQSGNNDNYSSIIWIRLDPWFDLDLTSKSLKKTNTNLKY